MCLNRLIGLFIIGEVFTLKREEKSLHSKNKILNYARQEFALQGYGLSSVNTICIEGSISKGILYHYFKDKDELYLACVKECFDTLTAHLQKHLVQQSANRVQDYFDARLSFFKENPLYQKLFCDAVISPPAHLKAPIAEIKAEFDALNLSVLTGLLENHQLQGGINTKQAVEVFRLFQDFVNARYQMEPGGEFDIIAHEEICSRSLNILLYGVVSRKESIPS